MTMHPNSLRTVLCATCGSNLIRRPINPNTKKPIANFYCNLDCKAEWQRGTRPISRNDLERLYVVERLSANEIAAIVHRNPKRVWEWLRDDGIETRPRGHDTRVQFKPGHKIGVGRKVSDSHRQKLREARIADGSKGLFRDNGEHVLKGVRGSNHPSWKGGGTPERQAFYGSDEWRNACKSTWQRADAKCERCGIDHRLIDRAQIQFHVHHVASFSTFPALRADPSNLRLLCAPCHRWIHSASNDQRIFIKENQDEA